jgi:hypothetical protein
MRFEYMRWWLEQGRMECEPQRTVLGSGDRQLSAQMLVADG